MRNCQLPLNHVLVHLHLTFSGLVCLLALRGRQEPCPFTTRLRVLKLGTKALVLPGEEQLLLLPLDLVSRSAHLSAASMTRVRHEPRHEEEGPPQEVSVLPPQDGS